MKLKKNNNKSHILEIIVCMYRYTHKHAPSKYLVGSCYQEVISWIFVYMLTWWNKLVSILPSIELKDQPMRTILWIKATEKGKNCCMFWYLRLIKNIKNTMSTLMSKNKVKISEVQKKHCCHEIKHSPPKVEFVACELLYCQ